MREKKTIFYNLYSFKQLLSKEMALIIDSNSQFISDVMRTDLEFFFTLTWEDPGIFFQVKDGIELKDEISRENSDSDFKERATNLSRKFPIEPIFNSWNENGSTFVEVYLDGELIEEQKYPVGKEDKDLCKIYWNTKANLNLEGVISEKKVEFEGKLNQLIEYLKKDLSFDFLKAVENRDEIALFYLIFKPTFQTGTVDLKNILTRSLQVGSPFEMFVYGYTPELILKEESDDLNEIFEEVIKHGSSACIESDLGFYSRDAKRILKKFYAYKKNAGMKKEMDKSVSILKRKPII